MCGRITPIGQGKRTHAPRGAGDDVFITLDGVIDHLFGDGGVDTAGADDDDLLTSIAAAI